MTAISFLALLTLSLIGHARGQSGGDTFYFSVNPEASTSVIAGQSAHLKCLVSAERGVAYYWQLNGRPLTNTTRRHQRGPDLYITRADRERDTGEFTCIALNVTSGFSVTSQRATLSIQWLSEDAAVQLQSPDGSSTSISSGDDVTLRCTADGSGDLRFEWYRNAERVTRTERVVPRTRRLHLRNVSVADNGVYRCAAHNEAGSVFSRENFALAVPGDGVALVRTVPSTQLVRRGADARFDCSFEGAEVVEWYFGDIPVEGDSLPSPRYTIHPNNSLTIHSVRSSDEGMYRCVGVAADKMHPQVYAAELQLAYLSELGGSSFEPMQSTADTGRKVVVGEGREFEVTCVPPAGRPKPRVWWRGPQGRVISDSGATHVDETRLIIESAKMSDAGNYSCEAENVAGTTSATIHLIVSVPPVITQDPIGVTVDEGASATLSCAFRAQADVTSVKWRRENGGGGGSKYVPEMSVNNGTLTFSSVSVLDRGTYQCEVNTTGFKPVLSKKAHLHVKEKLKFLPRPINKKFELGSFAKLYCKAQGATPPIIKWMKEGSRMFQFPDHVQDVNGTLHFNHVTPEDKGRYTCVATNSQGIINATIEVDVIVSPKFSVKPDNPTEAVEGNAVMIHCVADGDPKPTIQWDKNSVLNGFDQKRFVVLENGTLLVHEVHMADEGKYACTAGNSGGFKREEIQLIVRSREYYRPDGNSGVLEEPEGGAMMTKTVTITLSAAAAYMLLVVGLMVWCRYRRLRRKQAYLQSAEGTNSLLTKAENGEAGGAAGTEMRDGAGQDVRGETGPDGGSHSHSSGGSGTHHGGKKSRSSYDKLQFPRQDLTTILTLGHGQFGEVVVARARGMRGGATGDEEGLVVMVHSLQTRNETSLHEFRRQMDMHHKLRHENFSRLLGLCREADPHLMITEYTDWGDLKQLLLATTAAAAARKDGGSSRSNRSSAQPPPPLTVAQLVQLAQQVARGMEHLASQRLIHRDLAARNCLVTSALVVKVACPALCKDTYVHEYYRHHDQMIPLRWMPHEAVFEDEYSTKSDVWSFACLMWEMLYAGELPFSRHSDDAVLVMLRNKELQWRAPKSTPEPLQPLLRACWSDSPRDRPSFSEVVQLFEELCLDSQI